MRLIRVKLKGFKGIKRGLGLETLEIDFTKLPSAGLIAFTGTNGSGKSTTLDNLHPFRMLPSRNGASLYDLCDGSDALKELEWGYGGATYKSLIFIDAQRKKQEAYLYKYDNASWQPVNDDGKTTSYDAAVERIVGSERLFFLTAFRAQGAKQLASYTKGELKGIFEELLSIGELSAKGEKAKEAVKHLTASKEYLKKEIDALTAKAAREEETVIKKDAVQTQIKAINDGILTREGEILLLDNQLSFLKAEVEKASVVSTSIERLEKELKAKTGKRSAVAEAVKSKDEEYAKKVKDKEARLVRIRKIASKGNVIRENVEKEKVVASEMNAIKQNLTELETRHSALNLKHETAHKTFVSADSDFKAAMSAAEKLEGVPCVDMDISSACRFVKDAVIAKSNLPDIEAAKKKAEDNLSAVALERGQVKALIDGCRESIKDKEKALTEIKKYTVLVPELESAEASIIEIENDIEQIITEKGECLYNLTSESDVLSKEIDAANSEIAGLKASIGQGISDKLVKAQKDKNNVSKVLIGLKEKLLSLHAEMGAVTEVIKGIEESKSLLEKKAGRCALLDKEISEWAILEKALSKDGIIALEIDDAGPSISSVANDLLNSCFGTRFAVKFETTRPKKDGSGATIEVFDIKVIDTEQNEEKSIMDLSGGEKVWIEDAITKAICLYNKQQNGKDVLTLFTDEKDGSLDVQKKKEYLLMKRKVLAVGGYEREFFITHSEELQRLADARIKFNKTGGIAYV